MTAAGQYREIYREVEGQLEYAVVAAANGKEMEARQHLERAQEILALGLAMLSVRRKMKELG